MPTDSTRGSRNGRIDLAMVKTRIKQTVGWKCMYITMGTAPRGPAAADKRETAPFSLLGKNTVSEKNLSGYRVSVIILLSAVSTYRVFAQVSLIYRVCIP